MSPVPIVYRKSADPNQVFTFAETITGGQIFLYLSNAAGDTTYMMTGVATDSNAISTTVGVPIANDTWQLSAEYDFDILVNKSVTIDGTALFNFTHVVTNAAMTGKLNLRVRHWDGTTETELGVAESNAISTTTSDRGQVSVDVTKKVFKRGDTLRVTVEAWCRNAVTTAVQYKWYHDPTSRTTVDTNSTDFTVVIPMVAQEN